MHQGMCCLLGFKFSFKLSTASFKVFFQTLSYEKTNLQKVQIGTIYSIQHRQEKIDTYTRVEELAILYKASNNQKPGKKYQ